MLSTRVKYINSYPKLLTKFHNNNKSILIKYIFQWNIPDMMKNTIPITKRIIKDCVMKRSMSHWAYRKSMKTWDKFTRISQLECSANAE